MNTSTKSASITMPMPSLTHSMSIPAPSSPSSSFLTPANKFTQFFKDEDANSSLPYPTARLHSFYLRLDIKRDWNVDFAAKDSQKFRELAVELENELKELLTVDESFRMFLVHARKDKLSLRRILLTFVMQTMVNFRHDEFQKLLSEHIQQEEKILTTRAYLRDLKVRKIQNAEYEHLIKFGCNPCPVCDQVLKKHRKVNVNHPSVKTDILIFLLVMLSLALLLAIILLIVLK